MSTQPSQVRIAFGDEPTTQMNITWQVQSQVDEPVVEYGPTAQLGMRVPAQRRTYPYETGILYHAKLTNLKPGERYYYRVGSAKGGFSRAYSFRMPLNRPHNFHFTAFADHGTTPASVQNSRNVAGLQPTFHFIAGDLSYANGRQPIWDTYLQQLEVLASRIPTMVCFGNHENERIGDERIGYIAASTRIPMPNEGKYYYTYRISNTQFVAFNSNEPGDTEQLEWLDRTLAQARRNPNNRWVIVFMHHPPYGSTERRGNNERIIRTFVPLFDKHKVDMVICGHDHVYERMYPMRGGQATVKSGNRYPQGRGTIYITCGGGGVSLYNLMPEPTPWTAKRERTYCYLQVKVPVRGNLLVEAFRGDNSLIERFEIV